MSSYAKVNLLELDDVVATGRPDRRRFGRSHLDSKELGVSHFRYGPNLRSPVAHTTASRRRPTSWWPAREACCSARRSWSCTRGTCCAWHPRWCARSRRPEGLEVIAVGGVRPEAATGSWARSRGRTPNDVPAARGALLGCASILLALLATPRRRRVHRRSRRREGQAPPRRAPAPTCSGSAKRPGCSPAATGATCLLAATASSTTQRAGWGRPHRAGRSHAARRLRPGRPHAHRRIEPDGRPQPDSAEGATALLGCEPEQFTCVDDPNPNPGTLSSTLSVGGGVSEHEPLGW